MYADRRLQKLLTFTRFALDLRKLSTCTRASVGAIVVTQDFTEVLAIGYNGQPRGLPNNGCSGQEGACGCVHAEANAIIKLSSTRPAILISTTMPCAACASLIVNRPNITSVVYVDEYRDKSALKIFDVAGVKIDAITAYDLTSDTEDHYD